MAVFTLSLTDLPQGGLGSTLTVTVEVSDATSGNVITTVSAEFGAGTVFQILAIPTTDDAVLQGSRDYRNTIVDISPPIIQIGENDTSILTVNDNETATVSLTPSTLTVSEENASALVCVQISDVPEGGLAQQIDVMIGFVSSTAIAGEDFDDNNFFVTLPSTSVSDSTECFNTDTIVIDDEVTESSESFDVEIVGTSMPDEVMVVEGSTTVTIEDNDAVKVGFEEQHYLLIEGDNNNISVCADFVGILERPVQFIFSVIPIVDFTGGSDDTALSSGTLTLGSAANSSNSVMEGRACDGVFFSTDILKEEERFFILGLSSSDDGVCLGRDVALLRLQDDGALVYVSLSSTNQHNVNESSGVVEICVEANQDPRASFSVTLTTVDGTATDGEDYIGVSNEIIRFFNGGDRVQCVDIPILNDECLEDGVESFEVFISSTMDCVVTGLNETQVYIQDDDDILVGFTESLIVVDEESNDTMACVEVCEGELKVNVTITVTFLDGTATSHDDNARRRRNLDVLSDYSNESPVEFTFTPDNFLTPYCFPLSIVDDVAVEDREYFEVALSSDSTDEVLFKIDELMVEIVDNDCVSLALSDAAYPVSEEDGFVEICADLSGTIQRSVSAEILVLPTSATDGDFNITGGELTFTESGQQCVNVTITMDFLLESTEQLLVVLRSQDSAVKFGLSSAPVIIMDSNTALVGFAQMDYCVTEDDEDGSGTTVEVCVILSGDLDRPVSIYLTTVDATAIGGEDFNAVLDTPMTLHNTFGGSFSGRRRRSVAMMSFCTNISILADDLVENDEDFYLSISTSDPSVILSPQNATVTIKNNDFANVTLDCESDSIEVTEDMGQVEVCAVLTAGELATDVTVNLATMCGSACTADFTDTDAPLTFIANSSIDSRLCVNISINNDELVESEEVFAVALDSSDPVLLFPLSMKNITILIDDFANVSLVCDSLEVSEDIGDLEVCAVLTGGVLAINVTVDLSTMCGDACTDDFNATSDLFVVFPAESPIGYMSCANISIIDDPLVENDEYFTISINSSDPVLLQPNSTKHITIVNNDFAYVSLECDSVEVDEDIGSLEVCAVLTAGELAINVTVTLSTECGEACTDDFDMLLDYPLVYLAGSDIGSASCVNITIIDDNPVESSEIFAVITDSSDPVTIHPNNIKNITILDNDFVNVTLECDSTEVDEGVVQVEVCAVLTEGELNISVTVYLDTSCGDACMSDFGFIEDFPLEFPAESIIGFESCVNISISNDDLVENDEVFFVSINSSDAVNIYPNSTKNITIINNDFANVSLECDSLEVGEDVGQLEVCAVLVVGELATSVTVHLSTLCYEACNASDPSDYDGVDNMPLTFESGLLPGARVCTNITIQDDSATEIDEKFTIELSDCGCDPVFISHNSTKDIVILNNDEVCVAFNQSSYSSEEGMNVSVCAELTDGILQRDLFVMMDLTEGTALEEDYEQLDSTISFESFSIAGTTSCATIMITDDSILEAVESFTATLSPGTEMGPLGNTFELPVKISEPSSTQVGISRDPTDIVYVSLECDSTEVNEDVGLLEVCAVLTEGELETEVTVNLTTMCGDACSSDLDFTGISDSPLVFSPDTNRVCVNISINNDDLTENDEVFHVSIASSDAVTIHPNSTKNITIVDNDVVYISLECDSLEVSEAIGDLEVCAVLTEGELAIDVTVDLSTMCGDACGMDFMEQSNTFLLFSPDMNRVCVNISINDDDLVENDEVFQISLASSDAVALHPNFTKNITIADDDVVYVSLERDSIEVNEDVGEVEVCAVLTTGELGIAVTVSLSTVCGDACSTDFSEQSNTPLTFTPSISRNCVNISINDEDIVEDDEVFHVSIASLDAVTIHPNSSQNITILNNDVVYVTLERASIGVSEGVEQVEVCAVLTGELEIAVTVSLSTMCGSACSDTLDFTELSDIPLVFSANISIVCVNVSINDDDLVEDVEEVFHVSINSSDAVAIIHPISTTNILIMDNDVIYVSLECDSIEIGEDIGQLELCAALTIGELDININVTVDLSTVCGDACDMDFAEQLNTPLVFSPDTNRVCINISITDDDLVENNEMFFFSINSTDAISFHQNSTKNITILDDDVVHVSLECDSLRVNEDFGVLEACAVLTQGELAIDVTVELSTLCGEACNLDFFDEHSDTPLVFTPFMSRMCVNIDIEDDDIVEIDEDFHIFIASSDAVTIHPNSTKYITIVDNDECTIGFVSELDPEVPEGDEILVCVNVTSGVLNRDVVVSFTTLDIDAMAGADYIAQSEDFTFNETTLEFCRTIDILGGSLFENNETFAANLSTQDRAVVFENSQTIITIADDDEVVFTFVESDTVLCESLSPATACLNLTEAIGGFVNITVDLIDITTDSQDFSTPIPVTFGPTSETVQCVEIPIDDTLAESCDERFSYEFFSREFRAILPFPNVVIQIIDDDPVDITFFDDTPRMTEGRNEVTVSLRYDGCYQDVICDLPTTSSNTISPCSVNDSSEFSAVFRPAVRARNRHRDFIVIANNSLCGAVTNFPREIIRLSSTSRCSAILINEGVIIDEATNSATVMWQPLNIAPDLFSCGNDPYLTFENCGNGSFTFSLDNFPPGLNNVTVTPRVAESPPCATPTTLTAFFFV